jgi:hypothetical protein
MGVFAAWSENGKPIEPFGMPAAHIFKVRAGKIHEIEAIGFTEGYESQTGWEQAGRRGIPAAGRRPCG